MENSNPYATGRFRELASGFLHSKDDARMIYFVREIYILVDQFLGHEFVINADFVRKCRNKIEESKNKELLILLYAMMAALSLNQDTVNLYMEFNIHIPIAAQMNSLIRSHKLNEESLDSLLLQQVLGILDILSVNSFYARKLCDRGIVDLLINFLNNIKNQNMYDFSSEAKKTTGSLILGKECVAQCYHVGQAIGNTFSDVIKYLNIDSVHRGLAVVLFDTSGEKDINVGKELVNNGLAWPVDMASMKTTEAAVWKDILPIRIEDSCRFWAWVGKENVKLMTEIDHILNTFQFEQSECIGSIAPPTGSFVCVISGEGNFRGVVYSNDLERQTSHIFALDYGHWSVRSWYDLKFLTERMKLPPCKPLAIPCFIRDLCPRPRNADLYVSLIWTLTNFCSPKTKHAVSIVVNRAADLLADLVCCPDQQASLAAITVLNNLCYLYAFRNKLGDSRIIQRILARLETMELPPDDTESHKFVSRCLYCLTNLVHQNPQAQEKFFKLNGFCVVLSLAQRAGRKELFARFYQLLRAMISEKILEAPRDKDGDRRRSENGPRRSPYGNELNRHVDRQRSRTLIRQYEPRDYGRSRGNDVDQSKRRIHKSSNGERHYGRGDESTSRNGRRERAVTLERLRQFDLQSTDEEADTSGDQQRRCESSASASEDEHFISNTAVKHDVANDDGDCDEPLIALDSAVLEDDALQYYILGFQVCFRQDQHHELQPVSNPHEINKNTFVALLCGFLNLGETGSIYYGIDSLGVVRGIPITRKDRDAFRLGLDHAIGTMRPAIVKSPCRVLFSPVVRYEGHENPDTRHHDNDLYVVEIRIVRMSDSFYTCKSRDNANCSRVGYVRCDGVNKQATAQNIREVAFRQQELRYHHTLSSLKKQLTELVRSSAVTSVA